MNKRQVIASLNKIANELDNNGLFIEASTVTNVMIKIADELNMESPDMENNSIEEQFKQMIRERLQANDYTPKDIKYGLSTLYNYVVDLDRDEYEEMYHDRMPIGIKIPKAYSLSFDLMNVTRNFISSHKLSDEEVKDLQFLINEITREN